MVDEWTNSLYSLLSNKKSRFGCTSPSLPWLLLEYWILIYIPCFFRASPFYLKASDLVICCSSPNLVETLIKEFVHVEGMAPYFNTFQYSLYWKSVYSVFSVCLLCFKLVHAREHEAPNPGLTTKDTLIGRAVPLLPTLQAPLKHWSHITNLC